MKYLKLNYRSCPVCVSAESSGGYFGGVSDVKSVRDINFETMQIPST
jgi:hypothetical protein